MNKRLRKELSDLHRCEAAAGGQQNEESLNAVDAEIVDDDVTKWKGYIRGPKDTPYEGGHFTLSISIPSTYPYVPPQIKFDTPIWHPNISSQTGAICLDILKDQWSPALTIRTALLSIQALLSTPEPDDPQDAEVARMYKSNKEQFNSTARAWTENFARNSRAQDQEANITSVTELGFTRDQAVRALERSKGDVNLAITSLLDQQ